MDDAFVSLKVAARLAGVSAQTIRRWMDSGKLLWWTGPGGRRVTTAAALRAAHQPGERKVDGVSARQQRSHTQAALDRWKKLTQAG